MTDAASTPQTDPPASRAKTPIWFWIVAVIAVVWNFGGAFDYVMTQYRVDWYLAQLTEAQSAYFFGFPPWYDAIWASAVFAAFGASLALLIRSRFAKPLFLASIVLFVASAIYVYGFTPAIEMMGAGGTVFSLVIFASLVALWRLSAWAHARGILR